MDNTSLSLLLCSSLNVLDFVSTICRSSRLLFQRISNCQQKQYYVETILALRKVRISSGWEGLPR